MSGCRVRARWGRSRRGAAGRVRLRGCGRWRGPPAQAPDQSLRCSRLSLGATLNLALGAVVVEQVQRVARGYGEVPEPAVRLGHRLDLEVDREPGLLLAERGERGADQSPFRVGLVSELVAGEQGVEFLVGQDQPYVYVAPGFAVHGRADVVGGVAE